jgi:hypothetical protein
MTVRPPHAQKSNGVHQCQESLTGEERSIVHPRETDSAVPSLGTDATGQGAQRDSNPRSPGQTRCFKLRMSVPNL